MQWTAAQQAAIEATNDTVLVSAAAGSGKTAVLVERVTRLIAAGGDVTRLLIVTFTRAAAAEMRARLQAALETAGAHDAHMRRQALRVSRAQISTLHTFCFSVLQQHFQVLKIDPMSRIADNSVLDRFLTRATEDALEQACAEPDEDMDTLFHCYDEAEITDMAERIRRFALSLPNPWDWTRAQGQPYQGALGDHPCYKVIASECLLRLEAAEAMLSECERAMNMPAGPVRYEKTYQQDCALLDEMRIELNAGLLRGGKICFARLPSSKKTDDESQEARQIYSNARDRFKKTVQEARNLLPTDDVAAIADMNAAAPCIRALCRLAEDIQSRYDALKRRKNALDYSDLEQLCHQALQAESVRAAVAAQFDAIFVDEYQDVSGIQESIVAAVHENNSLFLVGDVKQSIYRFRLADPTLFLRKYNTFSDAEDGKERRILLNQNFRSDKNVLFCVNGVFENAMRARVTEIDYDESASLKPGDSAADGAASELHILFRPNVQGDEKNNLTNGYLSEARLAAQRIHELMETMTVRGKQGERRLQYRDIVILLRKAKDHAAVIAKTLLDAGIPVYSDADAEYFDLPEVADILNLLRVLDNPYQDLPLLSALRCPCFRFSEVELARIRLVNRQPGTPFYQAFYQLRDEQTKLGEKVTKTLCTLDNWRFASRHIDTETLVRLLLDESGAYMLAGAMPDGEARQANLRLLCERAKAAQNLHDFLETVEKMRSSDDGKSAKTLSDSEDVVRIMTMHKSKGLEFPVVILMELARAFRAQTGEGVYTDEALGIGLPFIDAEQRITRPTLPQQALLCAQQRKSRSEEARLLYVAMTRAKNKLILLASPRNVPTAAAQWALPNGDVAAGSANCMLDWVGQTLFEGLRVGENQTFYAENGAVWNICWEDADALLLQTDDTTPVRPQLETGDVPDLIRTMFERELPERLPVKTSVSAIAKHPQTVQNVSRETMEDGRPLANQLNQTAEGKETLQTVQNVSRETLDSAAPPAVNRVFTEDDEEETPKTKRTVQRETLEDRPRYMQEHTLTATERGSAVHKALGCLRYDAIRDASIHSITAELDVLAQRGILSPAERSAVRAADLQRFFQSDLGQRVLRAETVRREWAFNLRADNGVIVQGVLDLCFLENGAWTLVDYKTDAVSDPAELLPRYTAQMQWYARALRILTGKTVGEIELYSIRLGKEIKVDSD